MESNKKDIDELIAEYSWLIRPCILYEEEYKDCKSIKSRFHQHFVYGSFIDCTYWKRDYDNCLRWKENGNKHAYTELVESEISRRRERLKSHESNDIWEKRTSPPSKWNEPLPEWMEEKMKNSFLKMKANDINNPQESTFCVIM